MNTIEKLEIESGLFSSIGSIWPGERNNLSPLPDFAIKPLSKKTIQSLQKSNLLTNEGKVNPDVVPLFDKLVHPFHYCEIIIYKENNQLDYSVYFNSDTDSGTYIYSDTRKTEISRTGLDIAASEEIKKSIPEKAYPVNENTIEIALEHAWIFAAIFDLVAQNNSKKMKTGAKKSSRENGSIVTLAKIKTALKQFNDSQDWVLLSLISILTGAQPDLNESIESELEWLEEKNLIGQNELGYFLCADYEILADRLFPINSLINFHTATQKNSLYIESEKIVGVNSQDIILLAAYREGEQRILIRPENPETLLGNVTRILTKPEALFPVFGFEIDRATSLSCPVCGQMQTENNSECVNCGAPFSEKNQVEMPGEPIKNLNKSKLAKLSRKPAVDSSSYQSDNISEKRKGLRWWMFLLMALFLILILCFIFILIFPVTIRL